MTLVLVGLGLAVVLYGVWAAGYYSGATDAYLEPEVVRLTDEQAARLIAATYPAGSDLEGLLSPGIRAAIDQFRAEYREENR